MEKLFVLMQVVARVNPRTAKVPTIDKISKAFDFFGTFPPSTPRLKM